MIKLATERGRANAVDPGTTAKRDGERLMSLPLGIVASVAELVDVTVPKTESFTGQTAGSNPAARTTIVGLQPVESKLKRLCNRMLFCVDKQLAIVVLLKYEARNKNRRDNDLRSLQGFMSTLWKAQELSSALSLPALQKDLLGSP